MDPLPPLRLRRPPRPLWVWALMIIPVVLLVAWLVIWLVDSSSSNDKTPRGLTLESTDIGGLSEEDLTTEVEKIAEQYRQTPVEVVTPNQTFTITAGEIGLAIDVPATVAAAQETISSENNPIGWTASFFDNPQSELFFTRSGETSQLETLEAQLLKEPVNPSIILENGTFQVEPGLPGESLNLESALTRLLAQVEQGDDPLKAEADVTAIPPEVPDETVQEVVDITNQRTAQGLLVTVEAITKRVQPAQLRSWLTPDTSTTTWTYQIDQELMNQDLAELFSEVATAASEPVVTVIDNQPLLVSEVPALVCCEESAYQMVKTALDTEQPAVELMLRELGEMNDQSWLMERGIVELVGQFTTHYQPDQSRVTNIHRIAELTQGAVIYPGETFSVNRYVGNRTVEKGFVPGGVIYRGVYEQDVGGGISQYITTLFTAAFNAGMDFPFYQSHSLDIPRYREGVDATISWPSPDFQFANPNPYAVLLWPTVTDTSITVSLYSTIHAEVEWTARYDTTEKFCTKRVTQRSRTYFDDRVLNDSVTALYQPREGINCDGVCIAPLLPQDADGDNQIELDDQGLPAACIPPQECQDPLALVDGETPDACRPTTLLPSANPSTEIPPDLPQGQLPPEEQPPPAASLPNPT